MKGYESYANMFDKFFRSTSMNGTYKPVFVRALADIGQYGQAGLVGKQWIHRDGPKITLDLDFVAIRLAKYYWDLDAVYPMRHIPEGVADPRDTKRDIAIIELIRSQHKQPRSRHSKTKLDKDREDIHSSPPTLAKLASDDMKEFRKKSIQAMAEVLDHLRSDMPTLYKWNKPKNQIEFDFELVRFMKCSGHMIRKASCHLLARRLEQINPSARFTATISNDVDVKRTINKVKDLYAELLPPSLLVTPKSSKFRSP